MVRFSGDTFVANNVLRIDLVVQLILVDAVEHFPQKLAVVEIAYPVCLKERVDTFVVSAGYGAFIGSHGGSLDHSGAARRDHLVITHL
ncbi:hypothetical protein OG369_42630 [Streptomyces sp. NBC_01221]|uniref:hypothetical protein n=1 Tax=Streptomyces sp. NBC_01221 TaxID=2903782 RepID=UPI00225AD145|nr:hypothetical protein [Streptomyces sp. NBC_01221]MCX4792474.1 hypothetical protein [Streptomyces sp. NBC_01221]